LTVQTVHPITNTKKCIVQCAKTLILQKLNFSMNPFFRPMHFTHTSFLQDLFCWANVVYKCLVLWL